MAESFYPLYTQGTLDPQAEALLRQIAREAGTPLYELTPEQARRCFVAPSWAGTPQAGCAIRSLEIPGPGGDIPLRVYQPGGGGPSGAVVFFHGGGFVLGMLDEFDAFCTFLARGASCTVVSVGYRLAPEHKHPAAVEDALAVVRWVSAHAGDIGADPARIAVAGDSAGANLAVVVALLARDQGSPSLVHQVLISPWLDLSSTEDESFRLFGDGLWLSTTGIRWYRRHYLQDEAQALTPAVSPLLASDLRGLPPALIITAEFDVLRDQGEAYARRLAGCGVPAQLSRYPGMLHDFATLPGLFDRAQDAIDEICQSLRRAFA